ncbi:MAG: helix-turn-helix domain-containing protein [Elusimicrobiota bacterium]
MGRPEVAGSGAAVRMLWREIRRSSESRFVQRAHAVLAVCRGFNCRETAAVLGRSPRAVEYWVRRFHDEGIAGLRERPRSGRSGALTREQREFLRLELAGESGAAVPARGRWTGSRLRRHLTERYGVRLGVRQCQRLLGRLRGAPGAGIMGRS